MSLDSAYRNGLPVTLQFGAADVPANTTTDLAFAQGGAGWPVPTGYDFYPQTLAVISNADLTAGTLTGKVTSNGTAVTSGPEPALNNTVQYATAVIDPLSPKVVAGARVGVEVVANSSYAPVTADIDAVVTGVLIPSS